jgi:hypothetical protein
MPAREIVFSFCSKRQPEQAGWNIPVPLMAFQTSAVLTIDPPVEPMHAAAHPASPKPARQRKVFPARPQGKEDWKRLHAEAPCCDPR